MRGRYQGGQSGSLAGFIIVGVLLALVLVGGLYGLNRYNAQKASEETAASQQDKKTTEDKKKSSQQTAKKDDTSKSSSQSSDSSKSDSSAIPGSTNEADQSTALPHTGPSSTFVSLITVTLLAFAAAHFVQARGSRI